MARPPRGRRAGGALHTIEERYRLAMLATQDVIWDWDMVTDEVVWSEAVLGVFGYPANEIPRQLQMAHQWWIAHLHPEDAERIDASIQAFLRSGGDLWSTEYCFRRADGSYATVYDHGTVVRNGTRTPLRMVRALSDITARQQAEEALRLHMTQQAAIAAFGQEAIRSIDLAALMQEACAMLAHILHVDYCEVSELLPGGNKLLLRTGVGWKDGYVGRCMIELGSQSHSGYTLLSQTPGIVADLCHDPRFNAPLLCEHGVVSGLSVIIHGPDRPFGVLSVHTTKARRFTRDDIHFLQAVANILGEALIRQRTEAALRDSEAQYRLLFEANSHPMWVFDRETLRFLAVNNAAVTHFGYSREEFLTMTTQDLRSPEDIPYLLHLVGSLSQSPARDPRRIDVAGEWRLRRRDGSFLHIALTWSPMSFAGRAAELMLAQDITERKQVEEGLLRRTRELEAMVAIANALAGPESFEVKARKMLVEMKTLGSVDMASLRLPSAGNIGLQAVADSGPGKLRAKPTPLVRSGQTITTLAYEQGEPVVTNDYASHPKMLPSIAAQGVKSLTALPLKVGQMTLGTVSLSAGELDHFTPERMQLLTAVASQLGILVENARLHEQTEHRLVQIQVAHEQLQSLSQRLLDVQERERRHISQELHDEIGQELTALQLLLDLAERSPADAVAGKLRNMRGLIQELMNRVRHLSLDLRPPMLDDLGLLPTVLWHIKRYTTQSQVMVDCTHAGVEGRRFPPELETAAFRIVQEALTNVARHAKVKQATVRLWTTAATLGVQIEDQGVGFDRQVSAVSHLGLAEMQERTRFLGGSFTIETALGTGTRITAEWPLPQQD